MEQDGIAQQTEYGLIEYFRAISLEMNCDCDGFVYVALFTITKRK